LPRGAKSLTGKTSLGILLKEQPGEGTGREDRPRKHPVRMDREKEPGKGKNPENCDCYFTNVDGNEKPRSFGRQEKRKSKINYDPTGVLARYVPKVILEGGGTVGEEGAPQPWVWGVSKKVL